MHNSNDSDESKVKQTASECNNEEAGKDGGKEEEDGCAP
jgi:hypothetical protein